MFDIGDDDDDAAAMERSLIEQIRNDGGDEDGDAMVPIDDAAPSSVAPAIAGAKPAAVAAANPFFAQRNAGLGNMLTDQVRRIDLH